MTLNLIPIVIVLNILILGGIIFIVILIRSKSDTKNQDVLLSKINNSIKFSLEPMSDIPLGVEEMVDLATEIWRVEQRLLKISDTISDIHKKGLDNSILRFKKYLQKYDVEVQDYTGQKYNEGLNFDVLSREQDPGLEFPIIKETIEPSVICRGRIVKKAKVILASNQI